MRTPLLLLTMAAGLMPTLFSAHAAESRPNILFIAIDDLNHWVGYTGRNPQARTPNIDRLSRMGVSFTHAYCAAPLCNPARAALMSGKRPGTSACYQNSEFWKNYISEGLGLTATLKKAGYYVAGCGKIYHNSSYYTSEWDDYGKEQGVGGDEDEEADSGNRKKKGGSNLKGGPIMKMEGFQQPVKHDLQDSDLSDWHIVSYCTNQLARRHDKPFFLACGLHKPHLPWVVPRKYYDLFPVNSIQLPPYQEDDLKDIPAVGLKMAKPNGDHAQILASGRWKEAIQSYLACIAYTDMNVGRLLDALQKSPYASNTIICFWGDHGWHLGEKHHWRKFTLWEEAARAPMIWVVPGMTRAGVLCERTVDFMSIYPTLCELTGTAIPQHVEGVSMRKLLADPTAAWTTAGITTFGFMNHTVRTEEYRYIRYSDGGEEFYNEKTDPYEWDNRASSGDFDRQKAELRKLMPAENAPPRKAGGKQKP